MVLTCGFMTGEIIGWLLIGKLVWTLLIKEFGFGFGFKPRLMQLGPKINID